MKQNINAVQTQTTTDNSTATVDVTESKTKLVDVPTQSQAFIRSVAKNFGYDIKLMSYKKTTSPAYTMPALVKKALLLLKKELAN